MRSEESGTGTGKRKKVNRDAAATELYWPFTVAGCPNSGKESRLLCPCIDQSLAAGYPKERCITLD